jgi:SpoU rRNA methylase family enzyme
LPQVLEVLTLTRENGRRSLLVVGKLPDALKVVVVAHCLLVEQEMNMWWA